MNNFTKEELEIIRWYLQKEMPTPPESHIDLLLKIQSMIENYCEHSRLHTTRDTVYCENCCKDLIND